MLEKLKNRWRAFRAGSPGTRFQRRYRRQRERSGGLLRKIVMVVVGCVLILLGIVMLVLPGPGVLVMLIGAGLLAEESLLAARVLDRIDLAASRFAERMRARMQSSRQAGR